MIQVLFFAHLREQVQTEMLELEANPGLANVAAIIELLQQRGDAWASAFSDERSVMMAVNRELADLETPIKDNDEVAFFPPVTGG